MLACGEEGRKRWMEEIHITMSGIDLAELMDAVEDRGLWRRTNMRSLGFNESMAQGDKVR